MLPRQSHVRRVPRELRLRNRTADLQPAEFHVPRGMHRRLAMQRRDARLRHEDSRVRRVFVERRLQSTFAGVRSRRSVRRLRGRCRLHECADTALRHARQRRAVCAVRARQSMHTNRSALQQRHEHVRAVTRVDTMTPCERARDVSERCRTTIASVHSTRIRSASPRMPRPRLRSSRGSSRFSACSAKEELRACTKRSTCAADATSR